jgi:hypothetical protein
MPFQIEGLHSMAHSLPTIVEGFQGVERSAVAFPETCYHFPRLHFRKFLLIVSSNMIVSSM